MPMRIHNAYIDVDAMTILEIQPVGDKNLFRFLIDRESITALQEFTWYYDKTAGKVFTIKKGKKIFLSRIVAELKAKSGEDVFRVTMKDPLDYRYESMFVSNGPIRTMYHHDADPIAKGLPFKTEADKLRELRNKKEEEE